MRQIKKNAEPKHFTDWKNAFLHENARKPRYEDLHKNEEYMRLKRELLKEQGYICCYCERKIGANQWLKDCEIEHFMPRNPDTKLLTDAECRKCREAQLVYDNLFVSCEGERAYSADHCNHKKENWFDFSACVSPATEEISGMFGFRSNGKMISLGNQYKADIMIRQLNLNSYILTAQRKAAYEAVLNQEFNDELIADDEYIRETIAYYEIGHEGRYEEFCSMISFCLKEYIL